MKPTVSDQPPRISVIILNYNGTKWLEKCLDSLKAQTIFSSVEVIVADNRSSDGSDCLAEKLLLYWQNGVFIQHGENLGYCEGNNRAAKKARGRYLLFLNNDTWLEQDCLEVLLRETEAAGAHAANPLILNYGDSTFQSLGAKGFDIFGFSTARSEFVKTEEILMPEGCAYLIEKEIFERLGEFDREIFMFSDELDLSWRLWISGYRAVAVPAARLHHRGAANVNPKGGGTVTEFRTSETKRFYANRNGLIVLLKNAQHLFFLLLLLQLFMLGAEAIVSLLLIRRWSFVRKAYLDAIADCWRLRHHLAQERARIRKLRQRSDFRMLRFFRWRLNRWDELRRMAQLGTPKVTAG